MAHSFEVLTTSCPEASPKNVPLQLDLTKCPLLSKDEGSKLRRPVRPIDRQRMRPWLMELLDLGNVFGLRWTDRRLGIFQISWRHASRLGWNLETDGDVFERWAKHTGIYKEGDPPEPKRWKANFRCALHSLHDVVELTIAVERRGRNACRTYRFLQCTDERSTSRKRAKTSRVKEPPEHPQQTYLKDDIPAEILESCAEEEVVSHTEFESFHQDKVIVQKLDMKPNILVEDFCLHHDHDYAGPDKTHKTIVLRQGVGSVVLHQEVQSAPDEADEVESLLISNLDQLASAAMSSVGFDSMQSQEFNDDSAFGKASIGEKSVVERPEVLLSGDSNIKHSYFNVKYITEETHMLGDSAICSNNFTRKRKSMAVVDESIVVSVASSELEASDLDKNKSSLRICPQEGASPTPCTRQRTSSPKILCRKSKRSRAGAEKDMSGPSEPLMSSCLLLLEAATRLDNAEKTAVTSLSSKLQTGKQNLKTSPGFQLHECSSIGSQLQKDTRTRFNISKHELAKSFEIQCGTSKLNHTEPNKRMTSFEILRTTLENTDNVPAFKTKHILKESGRTAVNSSDVKIILKDAPFATGLFSGSKIEPRAPLSFIWNKHGNNTEFTTMSKNKMPVQIQNQNDGDCESTSVSSESFSETLSSMTCNTSAVTSGRVIQQLMIKKELPVMDTPQKETFSSEFDLSSDKAVGGFDDHCPQTCVSAGAGGGSQKLTETNMETDKIKDADEFSDLPPSSSSLHIVKEHPFLSTNNDKLCRPDTSRTPLISVINAHDICFSGSSVTKTYTMTSLSSSLGSVIVSPTPAVRTVKFTAASCHSTPLEISPIYSQAEIQVPTKSSDLHLSGCQHFIPVKPDSVISPSCVLSNCPADTTESSLLLMQNKDLFIIEPRKKWINNIPLKLLPALAGPSISSTKLPVEIKNEISTEEHVDRKPEKVLDSGIHETPNAAWQGQAHRVSVLSRPGLLTSTDIKEERQEASVSVIVNKTTVPVNNMKFSRVVHSETLNNVKSHDREGVLCQLISANHEKTPVNIPAACSCFQTCKMEDVTHSDITSADSSKNILCYSSNNSVQVPTSVSSNDQTLGTNTNGDKSLQKKHSLSSSQAKTVQVQSLAQLCKKYLALLFTTLDNQTSESDENDSFTESPQCELKDEKQEIHDVAQAVTLQRKLSCLKSGAIWQDVGNAYQHSENNVTDGAKVPGQSTDIAVSLPSLECGSLNAVTVDVTSTDKGLICSGSNSLKNVQEDSLISTSSVGTSSPTTADVSVGISSPTTADESRAHDNCRLPMDPTTALYFGEMPLFASNKGDVDSQFHL